MDKFNLSIKDIIVLINNSVEAAFINKKEKEILRDIIQKELSILY